MNPDKPQSSGKRILYLVLAALAGFVGALVAAMLFMPSITQLKPMLGETVTNGLMYVVLGTGMILPAYLVLRRSGPMELAPTPITGAPAPRSHSGASEVRPEDDSRYEEAKQLLTAEASKNANSVASIDKLIRWPSAMRLLKRISTGSTTITGAVP